MAVESYIGVLPPADVLAEMLVYVAMISQLLTLLAPGSKTGDMEAEIAALEASAREKGPLAVGSGR